MLSFAELSRQAREHRLLAGIGANLLSELGRAALLPVIAIIAARYLGAERYGVFATAQALTALGATFAGFGLLYAVLQLGARQEEHLSTLLANSVAGALVTASLAYAALLGWVYLFDYSATTREALLIMGTALFPMAVNGQLMAGLQVRGRYTVIAVGGMAAAVINVVYAVIVVTMDLGLNWLVGAPVLASAMLTLVLAVALRSELLANVRPHGVWRLFRMGFLFGLGDFLYFIYFSIDLIILSIMVGERVVGLYNVPVRVLVVVYLVPVVLFNRVLYPRYLDWSRSDPDRLRATYLLTSKGMLVAGLLCAASLTIVANPLLPAVFGSSFRESADLLRILALAVPLRYLSGSASAVLAATDRIATRVRIQALSAALNIALCFAMIPPLEARGAAIATVITEAFLAVALIVAVRAQMVDADVMRETRGWLLLLPAAALLAAAVSHLPEWTIVLSGVVALGSLAVIAGPLKYLGSFSLPLPTRPPENEGRVVT